MADITRMGVVGAGQMGAGIAQLAAVNGVDVWLYDLDSEALTKAQKSISNNIQRLLTKGQISQATSVDAVKRLRCSSRLEDLHSVDIVVEAIVESEQVKKSLFANLDKIVKSSAILASNTSSISITRLASATSRPSQVCFTWLLINYRLNDGI
ncbi:hypothetical protein H5410_038846 [Solanum commersonii]|uniref:3-hydroxyacyl-CoA dehydrogenase NAD binding domain-containing protein n=1 Tax=Solanum commersonii TaxID=4109 RepID=A0A9J5YF14_SOLCO|nr:hypothetical protein H5410_038846 [Solanum commersonii]